MCSKNADAAELAIRPSKQPRTWSITQRLTVLYVASTVALLGLSAGFLYWTLKASPLVASSHPFQVRVVGTPEYQYALEATTDFTTWTPLTTNTAAALPNYALRWGYEFSDPGSSSAEKRFYRVRQVSPVP